MEKVNKLEVSDLTLSESYRCLYPLCGGWTCIIEAQSSRYSIHPDSTKM